MYDKSLYTGLSRGSIHLRPAKGKFSFVCEHTSMVQLGCRPRNLRWVSVIILIISNMLLTSLLFQSETCLSSDELPKDLHLDPITERDDNPPKRITEKLNCLTEAYDDLKMDDTIKIDLQLGRWDDRRQFKMYDSILVGTEFSELSKSSKICLATQSSLEKLHSLVQVAHHWTASISIAIFIAGNEEFGALQKYLNFIRKCYDPIRERVIFSLAVPRNKIPTEQLQYYEQLDDIDCSRPEATLAELMKGISLEQKSWRVRNAYPQNHMRNLARKNCQNDYVFLTDVDIVPSIGLASSIDGFFRSGVNCEKCAYVVPTYELDNRVKFPSNKTELVRLAKKGLARPFHWKVFIHNQYATNFTRSLALNYIRSIEKYELIHLLMLINSHRWVFDVSPGSSGYSNAMEGKTYVSHSVTNFEFLYEPFYVSKDTAPPHDERFVGYGYTRNTQVYEMFIAGYQFQVLSPVFTVHWGLQTRKGRPAWRERQNIKNRKLFDDFKREIVLKYSQDHVNPMKKHA